MPFKVKFDILDYKKSGLLPPMADYLKHDEIINYKDYEKGNIEIEGNHNNAMDYIINMCWELFNKPIEQAYKTIKIFDYLLINISDTTVDYLKPNPPEEFFRIKKVIEDKVFRRIRMKVFL